MNLNLGPSCIGGFIFGSCTNFCIRSLQGIHTAWVYNLRLRLHVLQRSHILLQPAMPLKRKKVFARELDQCSPCSSPEIPIPKKNRLFVPPSLERRRITRSLQRQKPTCLVFGPLQEAMYSDFFFCHNCKIYEDAVTSGATRNIIKRESKHFACTSQHTGSL